MLAQYEHYFPGWGVKLLEMTERQVAHRHKLEQTQVSQSESRMNRGQIFSFAVAGLSLLTAASIAILAPAFWYTSLAAMIIALVGIGGPTVARTLALKFKWPLVKTESDKKP